VRVGPRHPPVERIVQKQVCQQGTDDPTLWRSCTDQQTPLLIIIGRYGSWKADRFPLGNVVGKTPRCGPDIPYRQPLAKIAICFMGHLRDDSLKRTLPPARFKRQNLAAREMG
jgi:hypothetical protein